MVRHAQLGVLILVGKYQVNEVGEQHQQPHVELLEGFRMSKVLGYLVGFVDAVGELPSRVLHEVFQLIEQCLNLLV